MKCTQKSTTSIPKIRDEHDKGRSSQKVNCILHLHSFSLEVVGPAHFKTICSQRGIGQQEAIFYSLA